jgi:hypothetical protein
MGIERAITRWYAREQAIQQEIAALYARLQQLHVDQLPLSADVLAIEEQLNDARRRLQALGPCPRPMMG